MHPSGYIRTGSIASNGKTTANDYLQRMWNNTAMVCFQHLPRGIVENHNKP